MAKKPLGCLVKFLITIAVIIAIFAILFVVFINLTPRQIGIADINLGGQTLSDLGIADVKFIDIYKSIKNLTNVKEEDVVQNSYDKEEENQNAKNSFAGSTLKNEDNYASIVTEKVVYDEQKLVTYNDKTLAAIFDNIVENYSGDDEAIKYLKDAKVSVKEMTILKVDGKGYVRLVCAMDLGGYKSQIEDALGSAAGFLKVPDAVYLVSELSFDIPTSGENQGVLQTSSKSICVNGDNNNPVTKAILSVVMGDSKDSIDDLNGKLGEALSSIIKNLGLVGTADVNSSSVVTGNIAYGMGGVVDHNMSVITYTVE